ncbi:porin [Euhalothece natronophila Z-M001]|uniref:Porin n=1 Tax=Euhalothece natronophila Z-M001 TaxID=522448 RepID=A0A5B8NPQ1_9CHRO|nr:iron uptake porin [Euhalothece natronophila]QDZ41008.1 porin [Euhalothece natronophila Z-M001]
MVNLKLVNFFKVAPVLMGASFMVAQAGPVLAQSSGDSEQDVLQQIENYNEDADSIEEIDQVNNVNQLEDVSPDDWAFEALRNLVERYGCIAGYPDGTFRGNQAMTRYEFAAGLNACLQQIEQLIAADDQVTEEDLATLERLVQEFEAELTTLGTRVDDLEGRVGQLEDTQFSTTTQLTGGVSAALVFPFGDEKADGSGDSVDDNVGLIYQGDINFDSSFTGRDRLRVQLRAAEIGAGGAGFQQTATGEPLTELFDIFDDTQGSIELNELSYQFPLGDRIEVALGASGGSAFPPDKVFESNFGSGGNLNDLILQGDLDTRQGGGRTQDIGSPGQLGAGISTRFDLTDRISFGAGYTVAENSARDETVGLFQEYSVAANLNYAGDNFDIGLNYGRTRAGDSALAFDDLRHDAVGLSGGLRLSPRSELGGWVTYVDQTSNQEDRDGVGFGANLALFDIGREGSKLALGLASPAFFGDVDETLTTDFVSEDDRAYVAELSYDFPVNDNVSVAPGLMAVFNPGRDSDNDTVYTGVVQTNFSF